MGGGEGLLVIYQGTKGCILLTLLESIYIEHLQGAIPSCFGKPVK